MNKSVCIILPVYNEEANLDFVLGGILHNLGKNYIINLIVVNDCSTDNSEETAKNTWTTKSHELDSESTLYIVNLRVNSGHQKAIAAGLHQANKISDCDSFLIMDADGQDDSNALMPLFKSLSTVDISFARRTTRSESIVFQLAWRCYQAAMSSIFRGAVPYGNFSAFNRQVLSFLLNLKDFRHLAATLTLSPFKKCDIPVPRKDRNAGVSHMNFFGLVDYGIGAMTSYPDAWIKIFSRVAFLTAAFGGAIAITTVSIRLFTKQAIPGWASTMSLASFGIAFQAVGFLATTAFLSRLINIQTSNTRLIICSVRIIKARDESVLDIDRSA